MVYDISRIIFIILVAYFSTAIYLFEKLPNFKKYITLIVLCGLNLINFEFNSSNILKIIIIIIFILNLIINLILLNRDINKLNKDMDKLNEEIKFFEDIENNEAKNNIINNFNKDEENEVKTLISNKNLSNEELFIKINKVIDKAEIRQEQDSKDSKD